MESFTCAGGMRKDGDGTMKDKGHRERVELTLKLTRSDVTPVNNFSNITAARSAGLNTADVRWGLGASVGAVLRYAKLTNSDLVKPALDNQALFLDVGAEVKQPDDNYGRVTVDLLKELKKKAAAWTEVSSCPRDVIPLGIALMRT